MCSCWEAVGVRTVRETLSKRTIHVKDDLDINGWGSLQIMERMLIRGEYRTYVLGFSSTGRLKLASQSRRQTLQPRRWEVLL